MENDNTSNKIENIDVDGVKEWIGRHDDAEFYLLDVRQPEEYKSGHIPGAVFIPLPDLIFRAAELDQSKTVLVYCRSGNRSLAAVALLLNAGFSNVFNIVGGIRAWNGLVATGSYDDGLFLLKGRKTLEELVSLAMALEEGGRLFYTSVADLTSDAKTKNILKSIACVEAKHKDIIQEGYRLVTGRNIEARTPDDDSSTGFIESGIRIEDAISFVRERGNALMDMLEISMQIEVNAIDLYKKILREIDDDKARKVFKMLIEEEKAHLSSLGNLIGALAS